jgi:hypothetical protein
MLPRAHRLAAAALALALALAAAPAAPQGRGAASTTAGREAIQAQIDVERRLLTRDIAAHADARAREQTARSRLEAAAGLLDDLLRTGGTALTLAAFERLQADVTAARESQRAASARVEEVRNRVGERLRRLSALQEELGTGPRLADPLSGRWQVRVLPQDVAGTFELRLDGTLVSGRYQLADGLAGSLRGTFVDNAVRLERVDAQAGFDSTFLGRVDPAAGRITGTWHANELAAGAPASGQWTAERLTAER